MISKSVDRRICEEFQNSLTYDKIDKIWRIFREAGNSNQGKITKDTFKKMIMRHSFKNQRDQKTEAFIENLFDRFRFEKIFEKIEKSQKQQKTIDLQDFVIGLVLISLMPFLDKVKYIFYLTDLDEDGCLSLEQIETMIERVQKIFCYENSSTKVQSFSLLIDMAHKKAQRNYSEILFLLYRNNPSLRNDEEGLITGQEFIEALSCSYDLYTQQKFIPLNISLAQIIGNSPNQLVIRITEDSKGDFLKFRKQLYMILEKNKESGNKELLKYPWKVQVIKEDKQVETLPQTEKVVERQKKNEKVGGKNKGIHINKHQAKQLYDQKNTEQTLQSYRSKVKKMIETKDDPRLNIKFDKIVRK